VRSSHSWIGGDFPCRDDQSRDMAISGTSPKTRKDPEAGTGGRSQFGRYGVSCSGKNMARLFWQGRVYASGPGEAALKIRRMWGNGRLAVLEAFRELNWFEYVVEIGGEDSHADT